MGGNTCPLFLFICLILYNCLTMNSKSKTETKGTTPIFEITDSKGKSVFKVEELEHQAEEPQEHAVEAPTETAEAILIQASSATPEPEEKAPENTPEVSKLFSVKTETYHAWVTQNGDNVYQANLEHNGSAYTWSASSASEAEAILKYHVQNQKL